MKRLGLLAVGAVLVVAQLSLLPALRPLGVVPDVALVLVILVALEGTASLALGVGVAAGAVLDIGSGANVGMWIGFLVVAAVSGGLVHRSGIETDRWWVPAVMIVVGTVVLTMVVLISMGNVVAHWPVGYLGRRLVAEVVLNIALMMVLRPVVRRLVPGQSDLTEVRG